MLITPKKGKMYRLTDLHKWFAQALAKGEVLEIFPANPTDSEMLWTKAVISSQDDIAALTQWLGGILP